jgi:WD40 repeat protein
MKTTKTKAPKSSGGATPKLRATMPGMTYSVHAIAFSPDGSLQASGRPASVAGDVLWRTTDFKPAHTLAAPADGICNGLAFSPDGRRLAKCDMDAAEVWDTTTGKRIHALPMKGPIREIAFSPDGKRIAGAVGKAAVIWDAATGAVATRVDLKPIIEEVTYHPDGRLLAQGGKTVFVIDPASGKVSFTIDHKASIMSCEVAPDGRTLLTSGGKHHTRLWDARTGGAGPVFQDPDEELVYKAMFAPDGKSVLTMNGEAVVRLWDIASGEVRATWPCAKEGVLGDVCFSADGKRLAMQSDELHVIDVATGAPIAKLAFEADGNCLAFSPDGKLLAAGSNDAVMVWEM